MRARAWTASSMSPSAAIQARIRAFEALGDPSAASAAAPLSKDFLYAVDSPLDDIDSPSTVSSYVPITPTTPPRSPHAGTDALAHRTSLIDLQEWVIDDGPSPPSRPDATNASASARDPAAPVRLPGLATGRSIFEGTPLINLESPPGPAPSKAPPLPPRKASYQNLRSASSPIPIVTNASSASSSFGSSFSSYNAGFTDAPSSPNMLRPPDAEHTYPPHLSKLAIGDHAAHRKHAPASSISSFHSVSLSSDGGTDGGVGTPGSLTHFVQTFPVERERERERDRDGERDHERDWPDGDSLDESFENVTPSSLLPPSDAFTGASTSTSAPKPKPPLPSTSSKSATQKPLSDPPKLPQRPKPRVSAPSAIPSAAPASSSSRPASRVTTPVLTPTPSSTSIASLTTTGLNFGFGPSSASSSSRRPAPPPPPSQPPRASYIRGSLASTSTSTSASTTASDRSSILSSTSTSTSALSSPSTPTPTHAHVPHFKQSALALARAREAPIPPVVRARYDAVFSANVRARAQRTGKPKPKPRQNAGWRGLSVDLITNPPLPDGDGEAEGDADADAGRGRGSMSDDSEHGRGRGQGQGQGQVALDARLDGAVVGKIWAASRLERERLREIWCVISSFVCSLSLLTSFAFAPCLRFYHSLPIACTPHTE